MKTKHLISITVLAVLFRDLQQDYVVHDGRCGALPHGSSVLRCHLAGLSRFSLLEFSSSVSRRHHSLLGIVLFHFSFPTCFFSFLFCSSRR